MPDLPTLRAPRRLIQTHAPTHVIQADAPTHLIQYPVQMAGIPVT